MGNRAVITTMENIKNNGVAIYLHWNGGRDSVEAFLEYGRLKGITFDDYGFARLCQIIGNFFGGTQSIGISTYNESDTDNGDNGVYVIDNQLNIIKRIYAPYYEQNEYDRKDMLISIDQAQPDGERFGSDFFNSELVPANDVYIGDYVYIEKYGEMPKPYRVLGYGRNGWKNGIKTNGIPYVHAYGDGIPEDNPNNYIARHLGDMVRVLRKEDK